MRRAAERNVRPDMTSPSLVVDHFTRFPPMTNTGSLRFAEALSAVGRRADAIFHARAAWVGGTLAPDDENRLLARCARSEERRVGSECGSRCRAWGSTYQSKKKTRQSNQI